LPRKYAARQQPTVRRDFADREQRFLTGRVDGDPPERPLRRGGHRLAVRESLGSVGTDLRPRPTLERAIERQQ
jgi:hypothetical protein